VSHQTHDFPLQLKSQKQFSCLPRRGFTIRLKGLKTRAPDSRVPLKFWQQGKFPAFLKVITFVFLFSSNARFLTMAKDLYRRMSANDWSEWRWAFSFYDVENWLLLRIMRGTKRLNRLFRLHKAREVLSFNSRLLLFVGKIRGKARLNCTVAKAADIQWSKMLTVCNTACVKLVCSLTSIVL